MQLQSVYIHDVADRNRVFSASIFLYAVAGYLAFGAWYACVGYPLMSLEEAGYAAAFLVCHVLTMRGRRRAGLILALLTICLSCARTDLLFGWASGAHYYYLTAITLVLGAEMIPSRMKLILCSPILAVLIALWAVIGGRPGALPLPAPWDGLIGEINLLCAFGATAFGFLQYSKAVVVAARSLEEANARIRDIANTDALTGICNRRYTDEFLRIALFFEPGSTVVGMIDIDDFKRVNDNYGHEAGDEVLKAVSGRLQEGLRKGDVLGRWGGEEFLVIVRDAEPNRGFETMERLRRRIADEPVELATGSLSVTVTIGIAIGCQGMTPEAIVDAADRRMYEGKRSGKNRVVIESSEASHRGTPVRA